MRYDAKEKALTGKGTGLTQRWLRAVRRYFHRIAFNCQAFADVYAVMTLGAIAVLLSWQGGGR